MKKSCKLINYFKASHYWNCKLISRGKQMGITRKLESLAKTRWYSLAKVFDSVTQYAECFQYCLLDSRGMTTRDGKIPDKIKVIIEDREHFRLNNLMTKLLRPVATAIGDVERRSTSIAD